MSSMFRWHQLTGPNNKRITWQPGNAGQYYFMDAPIKTQICGKKFVSALPGVMVTYTLTLNNAAGNDLVVTRDDINQALLSQIQVDGTTLGTLISAAHMKPGIIDTNDFISSGGTMMANAYNDVTVPSGSSIPIKHQVWIPFAYYGCKAPNAMAPMTSWIRPANLTLFSPTVYPPNFGSNITISNASYVASARMLWRDEIIVPPGTQMTRFKSTATVGTGSDTVDLKSFGKNSTLQGVEQRAAIAACLWASSLLSGDGSGAGLVEGITDMSALFAGIEQTNDISPFIEELRMNYAREAPDTLEQFAVAGSMLQFLLVTAILSFAWNRAILRLPLRVLVFWQFLLQYAAVISRRCQLLMARRVSSLLARLAIQTTTVICGLFTSGSLSRALQ